MRIETLHPGRILIPNKLIILIIGQQFHQTPEAKEKVKSMGMDLLEVDGCSEILVNSWENWEKFYKV